MKLNYLTEDTTKTLFLILKLLNILRECFKTKIKSCTLQTEINAIRFQSVKDTKIYGLPQSIVALESFTVPTTQFSAPNKPTEMAPSFSSSLVSHQSDIIIYV